MENAHIKEAMTIAFGNLYWQLRARLSDMKWLTVMKVRGVEYATRKFESEIHSGHHQFRTRKATLATALVMLIMIGAIMSVSTLGSLVATQSVSNSGSITIAPSVQLGVYSDSGCTVALSSISWGTLNPGATLTQTIYVKNQGNVAVTLSMSVDSWTPSSASTYLTLTWNLDGFTLPAGNSVQAVLSLTVSSSITGITTFSFNLNIAGTQS